MLCIVYQRLLGNGVAAPKEEDETAALLAEGRYGGIGKGLPTVVLVAAGLMGTDGEGGVEEQHTLLGPAAEVAAGDGDAGAEVGVDFLDDVDQRRRHLDALRHRETEPHGLARLMVGVLAKDDNFHAVERCMIEGRENEASRRIASVLLPLGDEELLQLGEVRCLKLRLQHLIPTGIYFNCHVFSFLTANDSNDSKLRRCCSLILLLITLSLRSTIILVLPFAAGRYAVIVKIGFAKVDKYSKTHITGFKVRIDLGVMVIGEITDGF